MTIYRKHYGLDQLIIGILAFTILFYFYSIFGLDTRFPGDLGDARFNQFILEHVTNWLSGSEHDLSSPPFFYPFTNTLYFSDTHFGSAIIYALARFGGAERETAFNIWFATGQFSSFFSCMIVLRGLNIPVRESTIGAFIFAFSLPVLAQNEHAQLAYRFAIPPAIDAFIRWRDRRDTNTGLNFLIWTVVQLIFSLYLGLFLILICAAIGIAHKIYSNHHDLTHHRHSRERFDVVPLALRSCAFAALAALLSYELFQYLRISTVFGLAREWSEILPFLPRPESYLITDRSPLWNWLGVFLNPPPQRQEHQLFPGLAVLIVLATAFILHDKTQAHQKIRFLSAFAVIVIIIATLNIDDYSFYRIVTFAAGFNALRAITRIYLVILFPISILSAYALLNLRTYRYHIGQIACLIIAVILSVETCSYQFVTTDIEGAQARLKSLSSQISSLARPGEPYGIIARADKDKIIWLSTVDAMLIAQDQHVISFSGYSGNFPQNYKSMQTCEDVKAYINSIRSDVIARHAMIRDKISALRVLVLPELACGDIQFP